MTSDLATVPGAGGRAAPADDVFAALRQAAEEWPLREFVRESGRVLTYAEACERAEQLARRMWDWGVRPADRVAVAMENCLEWVEVALATARLGAVLAPLSTRLVAREAAHHLQLCDPALVVVQREVRGVDLPASWGLGTQFGDLAPVLVLQPTTTGISGWEEHREAGGEAEGAPSALPRTAELVKRTTEHPEPELHGAAVMIGTSGTTGLPKCAVLGHDSLLRTARHVAEAQGLGPGRTLLSVSPYFHASGYLHGLLTCLVSGSTLITMRRYDHHETAAEFATGTVTAYHGALVSALLEPTASGGTVDAWCAGSHWQLKDAERRGQHRTCGIYGLTETSGCTSLVSATDSVEIRHGSNGLPLPGIEIGVADLDDGAVRGAGHRGEIVVRGWNMMRGYFRNAAATRAAIGPGGWFHTGDLGEIRVDGRLVWICRLKDVLRVGGENVTVEEIEQVLAGHPAVQEAAVIGCPDTRLDEVPVAVVVVVDGHGSALTESDVIEYCRHRLANFKVPRQVRFVDELPRTPTAKIRKTELHQLFSPASGQPG